MLRRSSVDGPNVAHSFSIPTCFKSSPSLKASERQIMHRGPVPGPRREGLRPGIFPPSPYNNAKEEIQTPQYYSINSWKYHWKHRTTRSIPLGVFEAACLLTPAHRDVFVCRSAVAFNCQSNTATLFCKPSRGTGAAQGAGSRR